MSKYNRKKENPATAAVQTDEFVSFWQQAFERARPYARAIGFALVGFVACVALLGGANAYFEHRAEGATEAWSQVVRIYDNDLVGEKDADKPKTEESKAEDDKVPRYKTSKERAEATLTQLDGLKGSAAKNARLFRAGVLYDLERYEEARSAYATAAQDTSPELAAVAREGIALSLEQLGKIDEAIAAYGAVAPKDEKASEFYRDRALLGLGRLYEKKGEKQKAIDSYKELVAKYPQSSVREDAQNRLAVLEAA